MRTLIIKILLGIFIFILLFNVFKNISYPLLWNDEGEVIEYTQRVLKFGYPKVHDGKNILDLNEERNGVGVNEKRDAYIRIGWLQNHFAAPWVYLSNYFKDFYTKTAILRIPFAVVGILAVTLAAFLSLRAIENKDKILFLLLFFFFEALSVFLALQLRSIRHHTLNLFLYSSILYIYIQYRFFNKGRRVYYFLLPLLLILLINSFFPVYIAVFFGLGLYEALLFFLEAKKTPQQKYTLLRKHLYLASPLIISIFFAIPAAIFYEVFSTAGQYTKFTNISQGTYFNNILTALLFFTWYEFLGALVVIKAFTLFLISKRVKILNFWLESKKFQVSTFLTIQSFIFILVIAKIPYFFERYTLPLQPIFIVIMLLDLFLLFDLLENKKQAKETLSIILFLIFSLSLTTKFDVIRGHTYEIFHQYKGSLDYIIPYIKENFKNPQDLVIATNYEEPVYMYYLGSKVIVGYVGNNLEEDSKMQPDIIILRWGRPNFVDALGSFLKKSEYEKVTFPIFDYYFNNIPELSAPAPHVFKTLLVSNPKEQLTIYVKKGLK